MNQTAHKILDAAEFATQTKGFNAFSYKDLQSEVGVKTSTMHYYFPTKQDLASALTDRYAERFYDALAHIDSTASDAKQRIDAFFGLFVDVARADKLCLCGMLTSDSESLEPSNIAALSNFFSKVEFWLASQIQQGIDESLFRPMNAPEGLAKLLLATLEGSLLIARTHNDADYMALVIRQCWQMLQIDAVVHTPV